MKTMVSLAQEAIDVQDASNLSGVVNGFFHAVCDLKQHGVENPNRHAITALWLDKINDMCGRPDITQSWGNWKTVEQIAKGEIPGK